MHYIHLKKYLPKTTPIFDTYWRFATERQNVFFKRILGGVPPFTNDSIIQKYKFTNAYRASDRVSQYLIKNVIYQGNQSPKEVFFRILLFKLFNKIETWELLLEKLSEIRYSAYNFELYSKHLLHSIQSGNRIYSGAYIMPSAKNRFRHSLKFKNHLLLLELLMKDNVPNIITDCKKMEDVYNLLRSYPSIGSFLAFQYSIDINYSNLTSFNEMDFVVPGPGAKDGISKCFINKGEFSDEDIIKYMADNQQIEFEKRGFEFKNLWGRPLHLIDCQNLFCEIDKYARLAHPEIIGSSNRRRIKQQFKYNPQKIDYWYPPKWGLNDIISSNFIRHENFSEQYC